MAAQTMQVDSIFTTDGEIYPFAPDDTIYGLSISGTVNLNSDTSLVRVILTDEAGNEWMVYEAYPMILPSKFCELDVEADETKYLQVDSPYSLEIQIIDANINIDFIGEPLVGLYLDEYTTGYFVEENSFIGPATFSSAVGIHLLNTGSNQNEIYNNYFLSLFEGIAAVGENRLGDTGTGLCIKCNDFSSCKYDIYVIPEEDENGPMITVNTGIAGKQGIPNPPNGEDNTIAAGNTFSEDEVFINYYNDQNCRPIHYIYHGQNNSDKTIISEPTSGIDPPEPDPTATYFKVGSCPSHFGGSINLSMEKNILTTETILISAYEDTLLMEIGGGNTDGLNFEVLTSFPEEALVIRQQLLNESPYLSDTVMKSAIEKENVLPNVMIRDVLVANPQASKSSEILDKIYERVDPMPEEMLSEILEGRTYKGNLEILEESIALHKTLKYKSLRKLESYYKHDTLDIQGSLDSLINIWTSETDPDILYKLAFMYLYNEDSSNCFSTLNLIPQLTELSNEQVQDYNDYNSLANILWTIMNDSTEIDSNLSSQLINLRLHDSRPGSLARNILVANGFIDYNEPIHLSSNLKYSIVIPDKPGEGNSKDQRLKLFPNPATDYIILSYDLSGLKGSSQLLVKSSDGKSLLTQQLTGIKNQIILTTKHLSPARYFVQLVHKSSLIESTSFIIIR